MESNNRTKKMILFIISLIIIVIILLTSLSCNEDGIFYEDLHNYLSRNDYKELDIEEQFLKDTNLYDENFTCETITYENNILEFHNCNIKEDGKTEYKDYCTYDGKEFDCNDLIEQENNKEQSSSEDNNINETPLYEENQNTNDDNNTPQTTQTQTPNIDSTENNEEVLPEQPQTFINFDYSKTGYTKENVTITISSTNDLLYCTTSSTDCVPNNNFSSEIKFTNEGNHKVCVLDKVTNETKCSETVTIDKTPPVINEPTITGTKGNNGWYKTQVIIKDNGALDNLSGISNVSVDKPNINYVTAGETVTITATDKAGNVSTKEIDIKVDNINPTISNYTVNGIKQNGWYITDVNITNIGATDNLSGLSSVTPNQTTFTTETAGSNFIITATDNAGNTTQVIEEIKIDKTTPTITQIEDIKYDIATDTGISINAASKFNATYGPSNGSITCSIVDITTLSTGNHDLTCTATSNNGLTSSITTTIQVVNGYETLEYIESTGTQFIDTGVLNTGDYIFEDEFLITDYTKNGGSWVMGGRTDYNHSLGIHMNTAGVYNAYGGPTNYHSPKPVNNLWYKMYFSRFKLTLNGTSYPVETQTLIPKSNETTILIGGIQVRTAGVVDNRNMVGKRKIFKVTDATTNELIRHFIPVKLTETNEIGMWDLVENKFYGNDGTGVFLEPTP